MRRTGNLSDKGSCSPGAIRPLNKLNIISYKNRFPPEGGREGGEFEMKKAQS
jgi:hypothetical protein